MMSNQNPLANEMRALLSPQGAVAAPAAKGVVILDSAADAAPGGAAAYALADMKLKAVAVLQQWAETGSDDLGDGESLADRLLAMVVGVADADKDGDISDAEQEVCDVVLNAMWDYLTAKGASDEDCDALFNNWDGAAADRVNDLLVSALPDGDEAAASEMDAFAFDGDSDSSIFDAVYKKKIVVRAGKKMRVNKRVSGHVRLSAKQKISIRKMLRKSHSATATIHRMKSNRIRKQSGL